MLGLLLVPIVLATIQYLDLHKITYIRHHREILRSFSAGFSVAYVFLLLFPELPKLGIQTHVDTALYTLLGFSLFHEAHKLVFKEKNKSKKKHYLHNIHLVTAGLYSFLVTFFLVEITKQDLVQGAIITIIIATHMILSEITQVDISVHSKTKTILITSLTLVGGVLAILSILNVIMTVILFSITAGAIAYIAIREEIPNERTVKPLYFLNGILVLIIVEMLFL